MHTYIALLRGINVGGHKKIKMMDLQASFKELGFDKVRSYLQSGNIIFESSDSHCPSVIKKVKDKLLEDFGFSIPLLVKTPGDLNKIINNNPFLKKRGIDSAKLHVSFLSESPLNGALKELNDIETGKDIFHCLRTEIYLYCPDGYGRTKLSNNFLEKVLSVEATTRNWKTVNELYRISSE